MKELFFHSWNEQSLHHLAKKKGVNLLKHRSLLTGSWTSIATHWTAQRIWYCKKASDNWTKFYSLVRACIALALVHEPGPMNLCGEAQLFVLSRREGFLKQCLKNCFLLHIGPSQIKIYITKPMFELVSFTQFYFRLIGPSWLLSHLVYDLYCQKRGEKNKEKINYWFNICKITIFFN